MANFEEMRLRAEAERRYIEGLNKAGVPQTGERRLIGKCERCLGDAYEVFVRKNYNHPFGYRVEEAGDWERAHSYEECITHLCKRMLDLEKRLEQFGL